MFVEPACFLVGGTLAVGAGDIGIVMVGVGLVAAGDEAATARSLRRQATIARATTITANAISAARARDRSTGRSPQGRRVLTVLRSCAYPHGGDANVIRISNSTAGRPRACPPRGTARASRPRHRGEGRRTRVPLRAAERR